MSSKKLEISKLNYDTSDVRGRVLWLVDHLKRHKKQGISTDKAFIEKVGLNSSYITDLRNGKINNPTSDAVGNIVKAFKVNPYWLLHGIGEPFTNYLELNIQSNVSANNEGEKNISQGHLAVFLLNQVEVFVKNLRKFVLRNYPDYED